MGLWFYQQFKDSLFVASALRSKVSEKVKTYNKCEEFQILEQATQNEAG